MGKSSHYREAERETMTQFGQYVTLGSDKAEKVAQTEAGCDGAVFAEVVAKDALEHRQRVQGTHTIVMLSYAIEKHPASSTGNSLSRKKPPYMEQHGGG